VATTEKFVCLALPGFPSFGTMSIQEKKKKKNQKGKAAGWKIRPCDGREILKDLITSSTEIDEEIFSSLSGKD